jgi:hypothetical protein
MLDLFSFSTQKNPVPENILQEIVSSIFKGYAVANAIYDQTSFVELERSHSLPWIKRDALDLTFKNNKSLIVNNPPVYGPVKPIVITYDNFIFTHHHNTVGKSKYRKKLIEKHNNSDSLVGNYDYFSIIICGKLSVEAISLRLEYMNGTYTDFELDLNYSLDSETEEVRDLTDQFLKKHTEKTEQESIRQGI